MLGSSLYTYFYRRGLKIKKKSERVTIKIIYIQELKLLHFKWLENTINEKHRQILQTNEILTLKKRKKKNVKDDLRHKIESVNPDVS